MTATLPPKSKFFPHSSTSAAADFADFQRERRFFEQAHGDDADLDPDDIEWDDEEEDWEEDWEEDEYEDLDDDDYWDEDLEEEDDNTAPPIDWDENSEDNTPSISPSSR